MHGLIYNKISVFRWTIEKLFSDKNVVVVDISRKQHKKEKKPKAKRYPLYSHHFRILKNDIRKNYAAMVANMLNSSDFCLIRKFFETFGLPGATLDFGHDPSGSYDPEYRINGNFNAKFIGAELMACILGSFPNSAPDYAFSIKDAQIRIRSDTDGCIVTANYISRATYVYDFNLNEITKEIFHSFAPEQLVEKEPNDTIIEQPLKRARWIIANKEQDDENEETNGFDSFVRKMNSLSLKQTYATPSHVPFDFTVQGQCIIKLDEQQRIENMTFTRLCCTTTILSYDEL